MGSTCSTIDKDVSPQPPLWNVPGPNLILGPQWSRESVPLMHTSQNERSVTVIGLINGNQDRLARKLCASYSKPGGRFMGKEVVPNTLAGVLVGGAAASEPLREPHCKFVVSEDPLALNVPIYDQGVEFRWLGEAAIELQCEDVFLSKKEKIDPAMEEWCLTYCYWNRGVC